MQITINIEEVASYLAHQRLVEKLPIRSMKSEEDLYIHNDPENGYLKDLRPMHELFKEQYKSMLDKMAIRENTEELIDHRLPEFRIVTGLYIKVGTKLLDKNYCTQTITRLCQAKDGRRKIILTDDNGKERVFPDIARDEYRLGDLFSHFTLIEDEEHIN